MPELSALTKAGLPQNNFQPINPASYINPGWLPKQLPPDLRKAYAIEGKAAMMSAAANAIGSLPDTFNKAIATGQQQTMTDAQNQGALQGMQLKNNFISGNMSPEQKQAMAGITIGPTGATSVSIEDPRITNAKIMHLQQGAFTPGQREYNRTINDIYGGQPPPGANGQPTPSLTPSVQPAPLLPSNQIVQPPSQSLAPQAPSTPLVATSGDINQAANWQGLPDSVVTGAAQPQAARPVAQSTPPSDVEFIKRLEGFSPAPFGDHHQTSIGYGTVARPGDTTIDQPEAEQRLNAELDQHRQAVTDAAAKHKLSLTPEQQMALTSFSFNAGTTALDKVVSAAGGDPSAIPSRMALYNKVTNGGKLVTSPGLINRRNAEIAMFNQAQSAPQQQAQAAAPEVAAAQQQPIALPPGIPQTTFGDDQQISDAMRNNGFFYEDPRVNDAQHSIFANLKAKYGPEAVNKVLEGANGNEELVAKRMMAPEYGGPPADVASRRPDMSPVLASMGFEPQQTADNGVVSGSASAVPSYVPADRRAQIEAAAANIGDQLRGKDLSNLDFSAANAPGPVAAAPVKPVQYANGGVQAVNPEVRRAEPVNPEVRRATTAVLPDGSVVVNSINPNTGMVISPSGEKTRFGTKPTVSSLRDASAMGIDTTNMTEGDITNAIAEKEKGGAVRPSRLPALNHVVGLVNSNKSLKNYATAVEAKDTLDTGMAHPEAGGFSDMAMIEGFQRIVNPGAVVRGQVITNMKDAAGWLQQLDPSFQWNKAIHGDKFSDAARQRLKTLADDYFAKATNRVKTQMRGLDGISKMYGINDPSFVKNAMMMSLAYDSGDGGQQQPGAAAQGGVSMQNGMVMMRAPDGTTMPVKPEAVEKYKAKGATIISQ